MDVEPLHEEVRRAKEESARLLADNRRLRRENARLRPQRFSSIAPSAPLPDAGSQTLRHSPYVPFPPLGGAHVPAGAVDGDSPREQRLALFRNLFRGREDIYAVRWERTDGRAGYSPASRSRVEREQGLFLPLTDSAIEDHLEGRRTIGVYPLLLDETCWFLAADFDKAHWQEDASAYLSVCDKLGVPAALERSRSGRGGHVWIFFEAPVPATQARKLGSALLTYALEARHYIGLDSYDRLFPNQDTLPRGGFGNLIALPLQGQSCENGNTMFLNRNFEPNDDQWAFLSGTRRVAPDVVERLATMATRTGSVIGVRSGHLDDQESVDPWTLPTRKQPEPLVEGPFPPHVQLTVADLAYVPKEGLPPAMLSRLWRLAAFQNPEFYRAQMMRLSTFGKPRVISCAEEFDRHIGLPRGCLEEARQLLEAHGIVAEVADEREQGRSVEVHFQGRLTPAQEQAAEAVAHSDLGVLSAPTAFGKTVVASWLIAHRQVNTLVLVHRRQLLDQWRERLSGFLGWSPSAIGQIGGGKRKPQGDIDIALLQSLARKGEVDDIVANYGQVIVDECHHLPAFTFERVLRSVKARYVLGLTATPVRKDGHHPITIMQCGPIRFRVQERDEAAARSFKQTVIPRQTGFALGAGAEALGIQDVYGALAASPDRNDLICSDLLDAVKEGRTPLLLTERRDHLEEFVRRLERTVPHIVVLQGGVGQRERRAVTERLAAIPTDESCVVLATGRYAGEGFDHPRLDTLLLALPIAWHGTLRQYVGRIQREHPGKEEVRIYDYVDGAVPVLLRMYLKRRKGYQAMGYEILAETRPADDKRPFQFSFGL